MAIMMRGKKGMDAGGNLKLPMFRSNVAPCSMVKVCSCASTTFIMMVPAQIGISFTMAFVSSTCVTVHSSHLLASG
jgi:hypothetical protein